MNSPKQPIIWKNLEPNYYFGSMQGLLNSFGFIDGLRLYLHAKDGLVVLIKRSVKRKIQDHLVQKKIEMGGLLIGQIFLLDDENSKYYVSVITNSVESVINVATSVSLTLGPEVWTSAKNSLSSGLNIIGWYHSHPGFGAFFSSTDKKTQKGFFRQPFQIGLVMDPFNKQEKWFAGQNSDPVNRVFSYR